MGGRHSPERHAEYATRFAERLAAYHEGRVQALDPYQGDATPIRFKCDQGHVWKAQAGYVSRQTGCPECGVASRTVSHEEYAARVDGTIQLLERYTTVSQTIKAHCTVCETTWEGWPQQIARYGCPTCRKANTTRYDGVRLSHREYAKRVRVSAPTVKLLGEYRGYRYNIEVKCRVCSFRWSPKPQSLLLGKSNCTECSGHRRWSKAAIEWLEREARERRIRIRHAEYMGEQRIPGTRYYVDGLNVRDNIVFEFLGDKWHGHPGLKRKRGSFYGSYRKTMKRLYRIKRLGYTVIYIWESEYNMGKPATRLRGKRYVPGAHAKLRRFTLSSMGRNTERHES